MSKTSISQACSMSNKRSARSFVEDFARPHFEAVTKRCAEEGRKPSDYYLVVAKYSGAAEIVLRNAPGEAVGLPVTESGRAKLQRLLAQSCGPEELLVVVAAGNQIE